MKGVSVTVLLVALGFSGCGNVEQKAQNQRQLLSRSWILKDEIPQLNTTTDPNAHVSRFLL